MKKKRTTSEFLVISKFFKFIYLYIFSFRTKSTTRLSVLKLLRPQCHLVIKPAHNVQRWYHSFSKNLNFLEQPYFQCPFKWSHIIQDEKLFTMLSNQWQKMLVNFIWSIKYLCNCQLPKTLILNPNCKWCS